MKYGKKRISLLLLAFLLMVNLVGSSFINVLANDNSDTFTTYEIHAKSDKGDQIDQFSYYPEENWSAGKVEDEYFTTVDATLEENKDTSFTIRFEGTGIEVYGVTSWSHGIIQYTLDRKQSVEKDTYSSQRTAAKLCEFSDLTPGEHTLVAKAIGKNPKATGGNIQVSRAIIKNHY